MILEAPVVLRTQVLDTQNLNRFQVYTTLNYYYTASEVKIGLLHCWAAFFVYLERVELGRGGGGGGQESYYAQHFHYVCSLVSQL